MSRTTLNVRKLFSTRTNGEMRPVPTADLRALGRAGGRVEESRLER
jgi:hypothetical protein